MIRWSKNHVRAYFHGKISEGVEVFVLDDLSHEPDPDWYHMVDPVLEEIGSGH